VRAGEDTGVTDTVEHCGIVERQHRHCSGQDARFVGGVVREGAVPVEVVVGEVEDAACVRCEMRRPVQLETGDLGGEHVDPRVGEQGVPGRGADVADGGDSATVGTEHCGEHGRGGGLAVGAGHGEPGARFPEEAGAVGEPRGVDVADHRYTAACSGEEQWRVRTPSR